MVQRNGARGVVDAKVHTPSGSSEECYVTELDSGTHEPHFIVQSSLQEAENFFLSVSIIYEEQISNIPTCVVFRQECNPLHSTGERSPLHRCQIQWVPHSWKPL